MFLTRGFDWLFVDQLFHKSERGETIFAPYGLAAGGYLVPPEREAGVRSGVRRLAILAPTAAMALAVLVPHLIEVWWDVTLRTRWIVGATLLALPPVFAVMMYVLSRLTNGLEPAPNRS